MRPADKFKKLDPPLEFRAFEKAIRKLGYSAWEARVIVSAGYREMVKLRNRQDFHRARDTKS